MKEQKYHLYLSKDEYSEVLQSLIRLKNSLIAQTVFSPEEIIALYENDDLAGGAWTVWNDIGCPVDKILIIIAKLSINEPIQKAVADLLM